MKNFKYNKELPAAVLSTDNFDEAIEKLHEMNDLREMGFTSMERNAFKMLTAGMTYIKSKDMFMYLDRDKYSGKGRPKLSDYVESMPLCL